MNLIYTRRKTATENEHTYVVGLAALDIRTYITEQNHRADPRPKTFNT